MYSKTPKLPEEKWNSFLWKSAVFTMLTQVSAQKTPH
jgi:hypothetical protein